MNLVQPLKSFPNRVVFAMLMALITTSVVVFVTVFSQLGFSEHLLGAWLKTFKVDYPIIVLAIILVAQPLQRRLFQFSPGEMIPTKRSRITFALVMAGVTVSTACFIGLVLNHGLTMEMLQQFARVFPIAYVTAIPFILLIAPKLQNVVDVLLAGAVSGQDCRG